MRLDLSNSWICNLHFLIEIDLKQNVILNILRHVELTNDIVWRIEGFRGWQFNRYKSIFMQLIKAVELMLFIMKDRNLNVFFAADNNQLYFSRIFSVYYCQMWKFFIDFSHLIHGSIVCTRCNFLNPKTPKSNMTCNLSL